MEKSSSRSLPINFFARPAKIVARELLGKKLVRVLSDGRHLEGIITETEAYVGIKDAASHSYRGRRTKRNKIMYGKAGRVYVYFTYGMHWLMNIVVSEESDPQVVLIRGIGDIRGPARVTKHFQIGKDFYGEDVTSSKRIWVEDVGIKYRENRISKLPRVGINYAGRWINKKLRFSLRSTKL